MSIHICLHGAESTGKSTLAPEIAGFLGAVIVEEYGRIYCEEHGTDLTLEDLRAIFRGHVAATEAVRAQGAAVILSDTDPLMTQAWAVMLFGERLAEIDAWGDVADFYLVPALDLPWQDDGTRMFGSMEARARFMDVAIGELERRGLPWASVRGVGDARAESAKAALVAAGFGPAAG
jgi:NadR type nicotinamide-nucleotide adenylyltransferase